jgi:hypothetical protein
MLKLKERTMPHVIGSPYRSPMIGARARSATVKVMPRDTDASRKAKEVV